MSLFSITNRYIHKIFIKAQLEEVTTHLKVECLKYLLTFNISLIILRFQYSILNSFKLYHFLFEQKMKTRRMCKTQKVSPSILR